MSLKEYNLRYGKKFDQKLVKKNKKDEQNVRNKNTGKDDDAELDAK